MTITVKIHLSEQGAYAAFPTTKDREDFRRLVEAAVESAIDEKVGQMDAAGTRWDYSGPGESIDWLIESAEAQL